MMDRLVATTEDAEETLSEPSDTSTAISPKSTDADGTSPLPSTEDTPPLPKPAHLRRHSTSSGSNSGNSRTQDQKRQELILTPVNTTKPLIERAASHNSPSPSQSPSPDDADPEGVLLIQQLKEPFGQHRDMETFFRQVNEAYPPPSNFTELSKTRYALTQTLEEYVKGLSIADLKFLSLYMHSVQAGSLVDNHFKTIRTECGFFGWFQTYGNTRCWQRLRSFIKDTLDDRLTRSDDPNRKKMFSTETYATYLQIFEQHSGRSLFGFYCGGTRSKKRFTRNYCPEDPTLNKTYLRK
jgi:hypothetical protein